MSLNPHTLPNRCVRHELPDAMSKQQRNLSEIHCCGLEDALNRIQEMYNAIPEDLGRDLEQVHSYQKKHEAFEIGLISMRAQVSIECYKNAALASYSSELHSWILMTKGMMHQCNMRPLKG